MGDVEVAGTPCGKCGKASFEDAQFCSTCGNSLSAEVTERSTSAAVKQFASGTASEIQRTTVEVLKSDFGKKMAAGAALGAVAAAAVPFVGWATGAVLGAGFIAYKRLIK